MIQEIVTILIIALAAFYLGRLFYRGFFKKDAACDSCGLNASASSKK